MSIASGWIRGLLSVALTLGLLTAPDALAGGKRGGGHPGGGGGKRAPRMSAPHRSNNAQAHQASRAQGQARGNGNVARSGNIGNTQARSAQARSNGTQSRPTASLARGNTAGARSASLAAVSPNTYQYGTGQNSRRYQAQGYGRGYRNRYSGHSGYGRSQGNNRAIVSRLRSVHTSLARLDHNYSGHRARAMGHLSQAIRQLSHRSTGSNRSGSANGLGNGNNALAMNGNNRGIGGNGRNNNNGNNRGANGRQVQHLSQAQSDSRMGQAMRTTQGISMQMSHQGTNTSGHARARGHVQLALRELHTALNVR